MSKKIAATKSDASIVAAGIADPLEKARIAKANKAKAAKAKAKKPLTSKQLEEAGDLGDRATVEDAMGCDMPHLEPSTGRAKKAKPAAEVVEAVSVKQTAPAPTLEAVGAKVVGLRYDKKASYANRVVLLLEDKSEFPFGGIGNGDELTNTHLKWWKFTFKLTKKLADELRKMLADNTKQHEKEQKKLDAAKPKLPEQQQPAAVEKPAVEEPAVTEEELALARSLANAANEHCLSVAKVLEVREQVVNEAVMYHATKHFRTLLPRLTPSGEERVADGKVVVIREGRLVDAKEAKAAEAKEEKPKAAKVEKQPTPAVSKDEFGNRVGTQAADINAAVLAVKKLTVDEVVKKTQLGKGRVGNHIKYLVREGYAKLKKDGSFTLTGKRYEATSEPDKPAKQDAKPETKASSKKKEEKKPAAKKSGCKCSVCKQEKSKKEVLDLGGKIVCDDCMDKLEAASAAKASKNKKGGKR